MTDSNFSYVALVADRSGSMIANLEASEGGINNFAIQQKKEPGRCHFKLVDFDAPGVFYGNDGTDWYREVFDGDIKDFDSYTLEPRYGTALLDAIGITVTAVGKELKAMKESDRPGNVIVVVQTDGQENSSREYKVDAIRDLIQKQEEQFGWTFIFLGADQDAISAGGNMGFNAGRSMSYASTDVGTRSAYAATSSIVTDTRSGLRNASYTDEDRKNSMR